VRVVAHLSDPHFGREDPALAAALLEELGRLAPALVVVSGDLTQRAHPHEFEAAARFLAALPAPHLAVPGNHDVPFALWPRLTAPFARWQRHIGPDLMPTFLDEELFVIGLTTARALALKEGRVSRAQLRALRTRTRALGPGRFRIVVTHHPFLVGPGTPARALGDPERSFASLGAGEIDAVLAGHHHRGAAAHAGEHDAQARHSVLVVQAGTCVSRRLRGEPNAFNVLRLERDRAAIEVRAWGGTSFETASVARFRRAGRAWERTAA
jgi:3',5'-cyclic AMP phosphodiesterase CpdA